MSKSITSIDDGFEQPVKRSDDGDSKPTDRITEPERTTERIAGFDSVSPFDIIDNGPERTDSSSSGQPRRRGRPPGSRNRNTAQEKATPNLIADFESLLLSVHFMGAKILSIPEMEIDAEESKKLSDAIKNVAKHYAVNIDPKKLAWAQLAAAAGGIYVPRFIAASKRQPKQPGPVLVPKSDAKPGAQPINAPPKPKLEVPSQMWDESPADEGERSPQVSGIDYESYFRK
jgi:hypothetical protein